MVSVCTPQILKEINLRDIFYFFSHDIELVKRSMATLTAYIYRKICLIIIRIGMICF